MRSSFSFPRISIAAPCKGGLIVGMAAATQRIPDIGAIRPDNGPTTRGDRRLSEPAASRNSDDARFMALALTLGRRGLGRTWPNPAVGAVVVKDGLIVGRGWTQSGGRPHAETEALARAGSAARGATLYVTLEPCSHHGKTPPCADAIVAAGVARVVSARAALLCRARATFPPRQDAAVC